MELFPDATFVRLRSHVHGTYLHADEDGVRVRLRPERATMNAVWKVHRIFRNGIPLILLYSTAYGRYLAATPDRAPFTLRGRRVVQGVYDDAGGAAVVWAAAKVAGANNQVLLQLVSNLHLLRANGKHFKLARNGVSVDRYFNRSPMMHWVVEAVPPLASPPIFAPASEPPVPVQPRGGGITGLFRRRRADPTPVRTIRYVRADEDGNINDQEWGTFRFHGRSAFNLRMQVTRQWRGHYFYFYLTVCARPGRYGRLTPLIADLPLSQEPMDVVVVRNNSPVEAALLYPNVDAQNVQAPNDDPPNDDPPNDDPPNADPLNADAPTSSSQAISAEIEIIAASDTT